MAGERRRGRREEADAKRDGWSRRPGREVAREDCGRRSTTSSRGGGLGKLDRRAAADEEAGKRVAGRASASLLNTLGVSSQQTLIQSPAGVTGVQQMKEAKGSGAMERDKTWREVLSGVPIAGNSTSGEGRRRDGRLPGRTGDAAGSQGKLTERQRIRSASRRKGRKLLDDEEWGSSEGNFEPFVRGRRTFLDVSLPDVDKLRRRINSLKHIALVRLSFEATCEDVSGMCKDFFLDREWEWRACRIDREHNVFRVDFPDAETLGKVADRGKRSWRERSFYVTGWTSEYGAAELRRPAEVGVSFRDVPIHVWDEEDIEFIAGTFGRVKAVTSTLATRRDLHQISVLMTLKKLRDVPKIVRLEVDEKIFILPVDYRVIKEAEKPWVLDVKEKFISRGGARFSPVKRLRGRSRNVDWRRTEKSERKRKAMGREGLPEELSVVVRGKRKMDEGEHSGKGDGGAMLVEERLTPKFHCHGQGEVGVVLLREEADCVETPSEEELAARMSEKDYGTRANLGRSSSKRPFSPIRQMQDLSQKEKEAVASGGTQEVGEDVRREQLEESLKYKLEAMGYQVTDKRALEELRATLEKKQ